MNKVLFMVITMLLLVALVLSSEFVGGRYLISGGYFFSEVMGLDAQESADFIDRCSAALDEGTVDEDEDIQFYISELKNLQSNAILLRTFAVIVLIAIYIFAITVIKADKIDFSVLSLKRQKNKRQGFKIVLYVIVVLVFILSLLNYPLKFLWGLLPAFMIVSVLLCIMVWELNIVNAIVEKKQAKKKKISPKAKAIKRKK